jgi:hypothetical protein
MVLDEQEKQAVQEFLPEVSTVCHPAMATHATHVTTVAKQTQPKKKNRLISSKLMPHHKQALIMSETKFLPKLFSHQ